MDLLTTRAGGSGIESTGPSPGADVARKQLRGSSLLLAGRLLSAGINFLTQVLIVRYLSTRDYGALAYALAGVAFFESSSSLGLRRGISRFAPIYLEQGDFDRLFGSIALVLLTIAAVCGLILSALFVSPDALRWLANGDQLAVSLLLILIFLVPLDALDDVLISLFASLSRPRAIFFRKNILAPGLKLAAVCLPLLLHARVEQLAWGYLLAALLGLSISASVLFRMLRDQGSWQHLQLRRLRMPAREMFAFALPLMSMDLANTAILSLTTVLLGFYHDAEQVALFRAVLPVARLNLLIMTSFQLLYMPQAARLAGAGDPRALDTLYWRTAIWMAVFSFPVFAATFSLAQGTTLLVFGERYAAAWPILALLAFAFYFNVVTGFNGITLMLAGGLRASVVANAGAVALSVVLGVLLIPRGGALGAALASGGSLIAYNCAKQVMLRRAAGISLLDLRCASLYLLLGACALALCALQLATRNPWIGLAATLAASLGVLWRSKEILRIEETFPELLRLPPFAWLRSARAAQLGAE